ncbi:protein ANTI-SILENCING 1-like isoform X1 [Senna tora]|uniref:Protein ANTI-SILENCING 1-like isoform X1 n=1 Tax=Senna tora TaxID=362788 RepID=A0A834X8B1_9FABA|nr:protein ANTI-SILENCING 1-like isoform X1 [Senna tora]
MDVNFVRMVNYYWLVVSIICRYYAMSCPTEANVEDETDFKWGNKRGDGVKNKDVVFYESFTYKGVEYFLYDCVYFYQEGDFKTSIGKLVRIFETPTHEKKVKVVCIIHYACCFHVATT